MVVFTDSGYGKTEICQGINPSSRRGFKRAGRDSGRGAGRGARIRSCGAWRIVAQPLGRVAALFGQRSASFGDTDSPTVFELWQILRVAPQIPRSSRDPGWTSAGWRCPNCSGSSAHTTPSVTHAGSLDHRYPEPVAGARLSRVVREGTRAFPLRQHRARRPASSGGRWASRGPAAEAACPACALRPALNSANAIP